MGLEDRVPCKFEKGRNSRSEIFVGLGRSRGASWPASASKSPSNQEQEDEQSCFSDNTHRDLVNDALGIENVWLGRYKRADGSLLQGPALSALVAASDAALADRTTKQIAASLAGVRAIQPPFDREIVGGKDAPGRLRLQKAIDSLVEQSKDLVASANAVGITRLTLSNPKKP